WQKRDLSAKRYVYVWADGIYLQARLEDAKQCILVIIGATPEGKKELLGFTDGCAKAPRIGASCCSIYRTEAWRARRDTPSRTARLASGRRSPSCGRPHESNAAGCTRPPTSSTNCRRAAAEGQAIITRDLDGRDQQGC